MSVRVFVGITGASGCVIALRFMEVLKAYNHKVVAAFTKSALKVAKLECVSDEWFVAKVKSLADEVYSEEDIEAPPASSSRPLDAYVIVPASITTLARLVNGVASNLIVRAALCGLRMRRPVVAVIREAPLGTVELRVLYTASRVGVSIIPAVVGFYSCPQGLREVVDFIVGKILDVIGVENELYRRWSGSRCLNLPDPCEALYGVANS